MPYRRVEIRTTLPFVEVQRRLASLVGPRRSFTEYFRRRTPPDHPFEGHVVGGGFQFSRNISYRNSFLPQIQARIELDPQGTVVQLRMSLHPLVIVFMVFWIGMVSIALFNSLASDKPGALIPSAMILLAIALTAGGFYPEAFKAERIVRQALEAAA